MAILFLLLGLVAAQTQTCQLRFILRDKGNDGWNGNYLTVGTDVGTTLNFEDSGPCGYSERTSKLPHQATLSLALTGQDSFKLTIPYGASLQVNFTGSTDNANEGEENTWLVEYWDVRAPYGEVILLQGGPYVGVLTSSNTLARVTCGPAPVCAVGTVNVGTPTESNPLSKYISDISWAGAFVDSTQAIPTQYEVSWCNPAGGVDCSLPDSYKHLGRTSSNHMQAIFPPAGTYQVSIEAYNQYGLAPAVFAPFTTNSDLPVAQIQVVISDAHGDGWPDDGLLIATLNGVRFASLGFACTGDDLAKLNCKVRTHNLYVPADIDLIFEINFIAPGHSAEECSFGLTLGPIQLESGQDAQGPTIHTFVYPINLPATPYKAPATPAQSYTSQDCGADTTSSAICKTIDFSTASVGKPCTVQGVSCRSTKTCGGCNSSQVWTCSASGVWASSIGCSCDKAPACPSFQKLTTTDCCGTGLTCADDDSSLSCNGPTAWGDCIPDSGTCGSGKQYRNNYVKSGEGTAKACAVKTESQTCTVDCPVDCVGAWSGWSKCSADCGSGYQQNVYEISVFPKGGNDCSNYHGDILYQQCSGLPDCKDAAFNCYYDLEQFDISGDGWGTAKLQVIVGSQDPFVASWIAPANDLTNHKKVTPFVAPNGSLVQLNYFCDAKDPDATDTSYCVTQHLQLQDRRLSVRHILESPTDFNMSQKPGNTQFTASCVNCANTKCAEKHRVACEVSQFADLTCGPCLSGYGLPAGHGDSTKPGTSTCVAKDSCAVDGKEFCSKTNQKCTNTAGGYTCSCDGHVVNGVCVPCSPAALLQKESAIDPIKFAQKRLEHQHFLQNNPPGSFLEMEERNAVSVELKLTPKVTTGGFYISRCDSTTCDPSNKANNVNLYQGTYNTPIFVGDDHADKLWWNKLPGYDYQSNPQGQHDGKTPQTWFTDGNTLSFATYPSYGTKYIYPRNGIPFGTQSTTIGATYSNFYTPDPQGGCCWAIGSKTTATGALQYWTALSDGSVSLSSTCSYSWAFWDHYANPTTAAPTTTTTTVAPTTTAATTAAPTTTTTTVAPTTTAATTTAPTTTAATTTAPTTTAATTTAPTTAAPTTAAPTTAAPTTAAPTTAAPTQAPSTCGQWNQTCCSSSAANPCSTGLVCDTKVTYTCQNPCPALRTRKEWLEMSYAERDTFVRAVRIIANMVPGLGANYNYMAYFRYKHMQASGQYNNVHNNDWFLPWHRFFLNDYNQQINALGGEFACIGIPYWDWSKVAVTSDGVNNLLNGMFTNTQVNGQYIGIGNIDGCAAYSPGHPFAIQTTGVQESVYWCNGAYSCFAGYEADWSNFPGTYQWNAYGNCWTWAGDYAHSALTRSTAIYNAAASGYSTPGGSQQFNASQTASNNAYYNGAWSGYAPWAMYSQILTATTFTDFNNRVNAYGHQAMHVWIGGGMGDLNSAALDPAFFMVHAFVDLLWAAWQACNGIVPLKGQDVVGLNPMIWNWGGSLGFNQDMPWGPSGRTPATAFDISNTQYLGYQYTPGFINNVISAGSATWCSAATRGTGFTTSLIAAKEAHAKRHAIYTDPMNPPRVVATSFLEAYTPVHDLPPSKKQSGKSVGVAAAKRLRSQQIQRGSNAKPGCYTPKQDEVTNLKASHSVYKKVKRGSSHDVALSAVKDSECSSFAYNSPVSVAPHFSKKMGVGHLKQQAQGANHHECVQRTRGKRADLLKSDYQKDLEKKGKSKAPKKVVVNKPSARFGCMEDSAPPTNTTARFQRKVSEQIHMGPM